ncbi:hypothetical protein G3I57_02940, partial [Streptomyces albidoflavus]|nr:hypothetical protein [Streptomyces albidoflavus]
MTGPGGDGRRPAGDRGGPIGFKSHLRATVVPGEAAYLVSQRGVTALRGTPAEVLVPLLDGTRDHAEVISAATPLLTTEEAAGSLRALDAAGLLRLGTPGTADPAAEAYWDLAGPGAPAALAALAGAAVALVP